MADSKFKTIKVELVVACPKATQFKKGTCSNDPIEWEWTFCGHKNLIDNFGDCHCTECGHSAFISELGFNCSASTHGNDYVSYKLTDMVTALNMATSAVQGVNEDFVDEDQMLDFVANLIKNIRKKWKPDSLKKKL
jgi:hypothetical protein